MQKNQTFNRVILAALFLWLVLLALDSLIETIKNPAKTDAAQTAYDRVLQSKTLRCGYILFPPAVMKDPNTGAFSGVAVDVMHKVGERLGLKIDWTEEVTFATNVQGLQTNRYDAVCITYWMNPNEGKFVGFSTPFYYSGMIDAQKCAAPREEKDWNNPEFKIAVLDGSVASRVTAARFPAAEAITLPNSADVTQLLMNVTTGKADLVFVEPYQVSEWNANNPNDPLCAGKNPLVTFPNVIALPLGDAAFKSMIDSALTDIINSGEMDQILDKHEKHPGSFYRLAKPFQ